MANEADSLVTLVEVLLTLVEILLIFANEEDDIVDDVDSEVSLEEDKEESSLEETMLLVADVQLNKNIHDVSHTLVFILKVPFGHILNRRHDAVIGFANTTSTRICVI